MKYLEIKNNFEKYKQVHSNLKQGDLSTPKPFVSIIIPTYKRPETLKEALASALNQNDFDDYEVVVIDNEIDTNTKTEKLMKKFSCKCLFYYKNEKNLGMVGNWNRGIELARGEWVTLLHDDDLFHSDFLKNISCFLKDEVEFISSDVCCGTSEDIDKFLSITKCTSCNRDEISLMKIESFLTCNPVNVVASIFRKNTAMEIGGFNYDLYPVMDYVFWAQLVRRNKSYILNKELGFYRFSNINTSNIRKVIEETIIKNIEFKKELYKSMNYNLKYFIQFHMGLYYEFKYALSRLNFDYKRLNINLSSHPLEIFMLEISKFKNKF